MFDEANVPYSFVTREREILAGSKNYFVVVVKIPFSQMTSTLKLPNFKQNTVFVRVIIVSYFVSRIY